MIHVIAFYLFAVMTIASAASTVLSRNPVHSVLWLILAFFNAAGLMVLTGAEFIAMLLVIVYVGAVAVLFLFVVMMLNIDFAELRGGLVKYFPFGALVAVILLAEMVFGIGAYHSGAIHLGTPNGTAAIPTGVTNTTAIGSLLYGRYLFLFEAAGVILLVAMIGAIVLTHRQRGDTRGQKISRQVKRRPGDATVNVKPEVGKGVQL
ncbi:NADH-quinone oxidoreductase subunit J [Novosphingobium sp. 9]|uniref:NADH-quinone oxidoreductase subunit J n=1 Tax=Novosphingobium sp. 9 TaxID=2025349 RepID=UPI0021B6BA33|nr:NADH-quinone oxidoreductase subunit J [Novosphingobium sp. 9]